MSRNVPVWEWRMLLAVGKKKPEKNQGFNGIRTRDLRYTGAMLYQLSYEAMCITNGQWRLSSVKLKSICVYVNVYF